MLAVVRSVDDDDDDDAELGRVDNVDVDATELWLRSVDNVDDDRVTVVDGVLHDENQPFAEDDDDDNVAGKEYAGKEAEDGNFWDGKVWVTVRTDEERTGRETDNEDWLQVAQQVTFPADLEQSWIVHAAALSPYSQPTPTHPHQ